MAERGALWQWLLAVLDARQPAALLAVVESAGSSPAKPGAKMAVTAQSSIGTIGGGGLEQEMLVIARRLLLDGKAQAQIHARVHHSEARVHASGMICGGEQTVLIYPCSAADVPQFQQILEHRRWRKPIMLSISARGLRVDSALTARQPVTFIAGEDWQYLETLGIQPRAYIVGGGHVGLALSRLLDWLGFEISVFDQRVGLETMQANGFALHKQRIDYGEIAQHIPEGPDVFVFVMTHSHQADRLIIAQLLGKQFAYLGLLGSQHKVEQFKHALSEQFSAEQWQQLHAPMGLPINSHSPEEIAISIGAELVQVLNTNRTGFFLRHS